MSAVPEGVWIETKTLNWGVGLKPNGEGRHVQTLKPNQ